jgi:hypothetical protein
MLVTHSNTFSGGQTVADFGYNNVAPQLEQIRQSLLSSSDPRQALNRMEDDSVTFPGALMKLLDMALESTEQILSGVRKEEFNGEYQRAVDALSLTITSLAYYELWLKENDWSAQI